MQQGQAAACGQVEGRKGQAAAVVMARRPARRGDLLGASILRSRILASIVAGIAVFGLLGASKVAAAEHLEFGIYALWFAGQYDDDRAEIDRFLECLVDSSNINSYWHGEVGLQVRGSWALPPPESTIEWPEVSAYLTPLVESGQLPPPRADETPLYLVFAGAPTIHVGACGRNDQASVAGRNAGIGIVRNFPLCWPTGDRVRTETQIAMHEIVETVDRVLGYGTCAAGGTCRGRGICTDNCDTFVGLDCPGAPATTWTGCDGGQVEGWVVQKLGYAGRDPALCDSCMECDFTPLACDESDPQCAAVPPRTAAPNEAPAGGCTINSGDRRAPGGLLGGLLLAGGFMVARARCRRGV